MEQRRSCPLCQGRDNRLLYAVSRGAGQPGAWSLVQCTACGMVYLAEKVTYEIQAEHFDWNETFQAESSRRDRATPLVRRMSRGIYTLRRTVGWRHGAKTVRLVLRHKRSGQWCDFGCGDGRLLAQAPAGFSLSGIDISPTMVAAARHRVPRAAIVAAPVTHAAIAPASLDVVTMQGYLEHEWEPIPALRIARQALKPGGVLVLKTPNFGCWNRHLSGWKWCGFRFPDHCNYFTRPKLLKMVEKAGLDLLPGSLLDHMPTSDSMYLAARRPSGPATVPDASPLPEADCAAQILPMVRPGNLNMSGSRESPATGDPVADPRPTIRRAA
jgi:SAM-dependent methyltransferase